MTTFHDLLDMEQFDAVMWNELSDYSKFSTLAFVVVLVLMPLFISFLRNKMFGQYIREEGPEAHHKKAGTPTGGGVIILLGIIITTALYLLWGHEDSYLTTDVWVALGVTLVFGLLGFADDYLKIAKKHNKGISGYVKLAVQVLAGLGVGIYLMKTTGISDTTLFNFCRLHLGWAYPLFTAFIITGASNAVNLTDGLDGLAASTLVVSFLCMTLVFTNGIWQFHASAYPDLALLLYIAIGATLGFLVFNLHPAKIFMGDTGSLALGGLLGTIAVIGQVDFWLALIGAVFVIETLSVIIQVISFKTTGKRVFKMSPIHHHFEMCGFSETTIVIGAVLLQLLMGCTAVFLYNKGL